MSSLCRNARRRSCGSSPAKLSGEVPRSRPTWATRGSSTQLEGMRHPASTSWARRLVRQRAPGAAWLRRSRRAHPGPSRRLPHTLAVTMMRSGRQLKACSATSDPAKDTIGLLLVRSFFCRRAWEACVIWQRSEYHRQHTGRRGQMRSRCCDHTPTQQPGLVTPCRRACAEAARQLAAEGWTSRPEWASCARGADSPAAEG